MTLFDPEGSLTILDENKFSTIFFVIVNSFTFSSEGKVYIISSISSSIIDRNALAPVFLLYASSAIASTESGSNDNSTLSILSKVLNCFTSASLGWVRIDSKVSLVRRSNTAQTGILPINSGINDQVSDSLVAQLLFLEAEDPEKDIQIYINSPGGSVTAGMAIYDTMQQISPDVVTICFGVAASMGAFLLSGGAKGKRLALPNSRIMIHQPLGGAQGQAVEIEIQAKEILFLKKTLNSLLAEHTGQPLEKINEDTERDYFLSPSEAVEYGLIDKVIEKWQGILIF